VVVSDHGLQERGAGHRSVADSAKVALLSPALINSRALLSAVVGAVIVSLASGAGAAEPSAPIPLAGATREWTASVRWENDVFGGTDRFYTNGVSLAVTHTGPSWMDPVADWLPWGKGRRTVGYDVGQGMATPVDKTRPVPDPNDRPYVGFLGVGLSLHVDRSNTYHGLRLVTGVVGPSSFAEETQRGVHRLVGIEEPQGWDYQFKNEPVLNLTYEYRHKFRLAGRRDRWSVEALPTTGVALGNALTQGQFGGQVRVGYNTPDDFGVTLLRGMAHLPPRRAEGGESRSGWGWSVFGGAAAHLVLRDITLDGSTFEDSPRVEKERYVPAAGFGAAIGDQRFQVTFTYVIWQKEFQGQPNPSKFGAFTFTYFFESVAK
jgi:hypothetical protein